MHRGEVEPKSIYGETTEEQAESSLRRGYRCGRNSLGAARRRLSGLIWQQILSVWVNCPSNAYRLEAPASLRSRVAKRLRWQLPSNVRFLRRAEPRLLI